MAKGWAVIDGIGQIDIKTVSDTERAAKVNWLYVRGVPVMDHWSDRVIQQMFEVARGEHRVVVVTIEAKL